MVGGGGGEESGNCYMNCFIFVNVSTFNYILIYFVGLVFFHSFQGKFLQICIYI